MYFEHSVGNVCMNN